MARRRPNAFEVSFPEEQQDLDSSQPTASGSARPTSLKRKSDIAHGPEEQRARIFSSSYRNIDDIYIIQETKRPLPPVAFYQEREGIKESADMFIEGEDPFVEDEGENDKPIRVLADFSIFDPLHRNEMIPLSAIEEDDGVDRQFEGAGFVFPYFINEEDEGQEDDVVEPNLQYVRLGAILRYTFDYSQDNDPVYIETELAWYILKTPSRAYVPYFQHFFSAKRIAQMVVSSATKYPTRSFDEFRARFVTMVDSFGRTCREEHLLDALPEIQDALEDHAQLERTPLIRSLLRKSPPSSRPRPALRRGPRNRAPPPTKNLTGNLDLAVLKAENQTPTHVTPRIAALAQGHIFEELVVVGVRPPPPNKALQDAQKKAAHSRLRDLVLKAKRQKKKVDIERKDYIGRNTRYLKAVKIDGERYEIGDFVIVPIGHDQDRGMPPPGLPDDLDDIASTSIIADYFWFAKILYGDVDRGKFHVHWLEHASQTVMEELGHPQELFFNDLCAHIDFQTIVSKVTVHEHPKTDIGPDDFFVKLKYDKNLARFASINRELRDLAATHLPPDNCVVCPLQEAQFEAQKDRQLKNAQGIVDGVAYGGTKYHFEDFVLYRAESGPAYIGYIKKINFPVRETAAIQTTVTVRRVGRIASLAHILPSHVVKDERHVFLTNEEATVRVQDLIQVCFVFPYESVPDLQEWLSLSPVHFYIRYTFPSLRANSWNDKRALSCETLLVCAECVGVRLEERTKMRKFLEYAKNNPLPTLDLFGGVGAFGMGLSAGSGCLKVTDSIEKSPSAAKTTMRNFPNVAVHNQCANIMMRYSIKEKEGHRPDAPRQLFDENMAIPGPIKPPRCIACGFPCQSHSDLNMFKRADDIKSNLILNALSWVDFTRPDICYFENVPGFLRFAFDAVQSGVHRVEGGIPMGGLKFLVRALVDMGYQVQFGLLQAAHYGAPQRRNRFFLVAAIDGHPMPELPQPTHDFGDPRGLSIKLPIGGPPVRPVRTDNGTAPHPSVTIDDAISDLPRFDWKHPNLKGLPPKKQREYLARKEQIPALSCKYTEQFCGFTGIIGYHHAPKTTYQALARVKPTTDIQQFTRCLLPKKVERVISIPLAAQADYRDLPPDQFEWQMANPLSSVARKNYRAGLYGRLDKDGCFPTTVTNMDPTAKQSWVLNPYCRRMVTVRELARSQGFPDHFVFESIDTINVVTMHRQIGNAVPLQVGTALGRELRAALFKKWEQGLDDAIIIDD